MLNSEPQKGLVKGGSIYIKACTFTKSGQGKEQG